MTGSAPQGKRNCVLRCDSGTVSKNRDCGVNRSTLWQVNGVLDSATNVTGGGSFVKLLSKTWGSGFFGPYSFLPPGRHVGSALNFGPEHVRQRSNRHHTTFTPPHAP